MKTNKTINNQYKSCSTCNYKKFNDYYTKNNVNKTHEKCKSCKSTSGVYNNWKPSCFICIHNPQDNNYNITHCENCNKENFVPKKECYTSCLRIC